MKAKELAEILLKNPNLEVFINTEFGLWKPEARIETVFDHGTKNPVIMEEGLKPYADKKTKRKAIVIG